jgi:hypothetical protein
MTTHFEKMKMGGSRGLSKAEMEILNSFHLEDTDMSWQDDAYCRDTGIDFFPETGFNGKALPAMQLWRNLPRQRTLPRVRYEQQHQLGYLGWQNGTQPTQPQTVQVCTQRPRTSPTIE